MLNQLVLCLSMLSATEAELAEARAKAAIAIAAAEKAVVKANNEVEHPQLVVIPPAAPLTEQVKPCPCACGKRDCDCKTKCKCGCNKCGCKCTDGSCRKEKDPEFLTAPAPQPKPAPYTQYLKFSATWCGPCKAADADLNPWLKASGWKVSKDVDSHVRIVDIDEDKELARKYSIHAVPTYVLVQEGKELARFEGYPGRDKIVKAYVDAVKARNMRICAVAYEDEAPVVTPVAIKNALLTTSPVVRDTSGTSKPRLVMPTSVKAQDSSSACGITAPSYQLQMPQTFYSSGPMGSSCSDGSCGMNSMQMQSFPVQSFTPSYQMQSFPSQGFQQWNSMDGGCAGGNCSMQMQSTRGHRRGR